MSTTVSTFFFGLGFGLLFAFTTPFFVSAYAISTPYWCGWGWSSAPCANYMPQPYTYSSYYYPANYAYSYSNYSYGNSCYPVSYDSRGNVVQTSCDVNYGYQNWYQPYPQYPSYHPRYEYNRYDKDYDRGNYDWHDRDWHHRD